MSCPPMNEICAERDIRRSISMIGYLESHSYWYNRIPEMVIDRVGYGNAFFRVFHELYTDCGSGVGVMSHIFGEIN